MVCHVLLFQNRLYLIHSSQDTLILPTESNGLSDQEKKFKIDFQDGGHLGFQIRMILAIVTSILTTKFQINWPFGSGEDQNTFSRLQPWQSSWSFS